MSDLVTNLEKKTEKRNINSAKKEYLLIEKEIDCPRCYGIMMLHLEFDLPGYFCEECDFVLHLIRYS